MPHSSLRTVLVVFLLWLAGLGAAAQFAKIAVPFSSIRTLYPEAGAELGWLLSLISLLGVVLGMTVGVIVARLGCDRALIPALIIGSGISLWQATLPNLSWMLVSRLIEGATHLIIVVAAPTLIAQISSKRYRGVAMTLWSTFFSVTFAIVAWIGLPFVDAYGVHALFIAHGSFLLTLAVLFLFCFRSLDVSINLSSTPISFKKILHQHLAAYSSPFIFAPAVGWFFYTLTFVSLLAILPDLLLEQNRNQIAALMPLASIAVSLLFVSPMLSVFSATKLVIVGFAVAGAAVSLFWTDLAAPHKCVALFAALGIIQGASFAAIPELSATAEARALANGAIAQMGNLGNTLGLPLLLMVQSWSGLNGILFTVLAAYAAGCIAHIFLAYLRHVQPGKYVKMG